VLDELPERIPSLDWVDPTRADLAAYRRATADAPASPVVDVDELRKLGGATLGDLWPKMTNEERVDALRALGAVVVIAPASQRRAPLEGRVTLRVPWVPLEPTG
jgi:hypothetical protein